MATIPITKRGAEKLKAELHRLKTVDRPSVINAISEARAQGDLSENAEYDAAKDRQGFIEVGHAVIRVADCNNWNYETYKDLNAVIPFLKNN